MMVRSGLSVIDDLRAKKGREMMYEGMREYFRVCRGCTWVCADASGGRWLDVG